MMNTATVNCPSCGESFEVALPPLREIPCEVDYDCEVCCRPMRLFFQEEDGDVLAYASGVND